ncbi:transcriptional activator of glycolytic enzymes-domain-containing protein [Truncatella angustata]|uniref:Transcriptional activator of glycolytic enzymes-domain-containing protein n=1 Tax=Truncatella angustata TaxID=152316 RepID=A0A9P8RFM5_9PEZI|nr:transcriptional activator of glycolytic enzymes-domain-containing protein [Truncatella angustata]KAH6645143.1 transcriptional activator of glycolytic enzymes-domain-containing protein [Truncatella angustata]
MLPSPAGPGISTPNTTAAGSKGSKRSASDLQHNAGYPQATPSKRHANNKASAAAVPTTVPAFNVASGPAMGVGLGVGVGIGAGASTQIANMSSHAGLSNSQPPSVQTHQPPMMVTEDQLVGRTPDQLIGTILQIQAQHQQYVATISAQYNGLSAQYNNITQQLDDMKQLQGSPQGYMDSRTSRPVAPPVTTLPQQSPTGPPRLPASQPTTRPTRPPPQSPQSSHMDARLLPKQPHLQPPQTPGPPAYDYRTVGTVEEVWKEYRHGIDGQPAVEQLDADWGSRWRPEPRGRTWYSRRKVIWDKIKEYMADNMPEDEAVKEVEKLRDGGTINKLIRMLQDERKDKGIADDSTVA